MKKITIGLFCDSFFPIVDGVVNVVDNYAKRLTLYGKVIVFVPKYSKAFDDTKLPYKVVRCNSIKVPTIDYCLPTPDIDPSFKKELDSYHLDIVHIHSPFTLGKIGIKYAKDNNIPCIGTMHSQFKQDFYRSFKNDIIADILTKRLVIDVFDKCDKCYAVNDEIARLFYEDYGYKEMPGVLRNATDMMPISKKEAEKYVDNFLDINKDIKVFLFVGRLNKLKNILFIVDSLKYIKDLDYKMVFIGDGQDEEELRNYIKQNNMEDHILLLGKITDRKILSYYYNRANLFLFPSLYDASSLVQVEAACQSTPTLFVKGAATCSNITDKVNGFIAENNPEKYAKYLLEIVNNKKLLNKVSENAYNDLYLTWDEVVKKVYDTYLELINEYHK